MTGPVIGAPPAVKYLRANQKGAANGVAPLGEDKKLPAENLPEIAAKDVAYDDAATELGADKVQAAIAALKSAVDKKQAGISGAEGQLVSFDKEGKPVPVDPDALELGGGGKAVSATLTTSGWTLGSDERYYQTVSVEGVTTDATQVIVVDPALTGTDLDADAAVLEAWQNPSAHNVAQGDGTLTFYSYEVPSVNIPLNVGVG